MLLAYLRGLLKPDYPQGTSSIIREELILAALKNEIDVDLIKYQTLITSSFVTLFKHDSASKTMTELFGTVKTIRCLLLNEKQEHKPKGIDASIKLYHALDKSGLL